MNRLHPIPRALLWSLTIVPAALLFIAATATLNYLSPPIVATIADLTNRTASASSIAPWTLVSGRAKPGDFGAPILYRWDATNTLPVSAIRLAVAGRETGRLVHAWDGDLRVFGALGDGTDQTDAMQSAIDSLPGSFWKVEAGAPSVNTAPTSSVPLVLRVPAGVYTVRGLNLKHQTRIVGDGLSSVIRLADGADRPLILASNVVGCVIENLVLSGNRANQTSTNAHALALYSSTYGMPAHKVRKVWIEDANGAGVYVHNGSINEFSHLEITKCRIGFWSYAGTDSILDNADIRFCDERGMQWTFGGYWKVSNVKVWACRIPTWDLTVTNVTPAAATMGVDSGAVIVCGRGHRFTNFEVQENGSIGMQIGTLQYQCQSSFFDLMIDGNGGWNATNDVVTAENWRRDGLQLVNYYGVEVNVVADDFRARQGKGRQGRGVVFLGTMPEFVSGGNAIQADNWYRIVDVGGGAVFTNIQYSLAVKKNAVGDVFQAQTYDYSNPVPQSWGTSGKLYAANDLARVRATVINQYDQNAGTGTGWQIDNAGPLCEIQIKTTLDEFSRSAGHRWSSSGNLTNFATAPVWTIDAGTNGTASGLRVNVRNVAASPTGEALFRMQSNGTNWFRVNTESVGNINNTPLLVRVGTNEWQMLLGPSDSAGPGRRAVYLANYTNTAGTVWQPPVTVSTVADLTNRVPDTASLLVLTLGHASVGDGQSRLYRWAAGDATAVDGTNVFSSIYGTGRWRSVLFAGTGGGGGGGGLVDGDYGDWTVSGGVATIDSGVITSGKILDGTITTNDLAAAAHAALRSPDFGAGIVSGASFRAVPVALGAGTVLTNGTYYTATLSANRTVTFSGTPAEGQVIGLYVNATAVSTLTFPSSVDGAGGSTVTTKLLQVGRHELSWKYQGAEWVFSGTPVLENLAATGAPTTGDDAADGYSITSRWYDTTSDREYVCLDATVGAAVWRLSTPIIGTDAQAYDADLDDLADGSLSGGKVGSGINADNVTSGTLADARIASTITRDSELDTAVGPITGVADAFITLDEHSSAPATPASGKVAVYAKADGKVYRKDDAGTEAELGGGGGSYTGSNGITLSGSNFAIDPIWFATNRTSSSVIWWEYDFQGGGSSSPPFTFSNGNSGTSFEDTGYENHPWVWTSSTSTSTNAYAGAITPAASIVLPSTNWWYVRWDINTPSASTSADIWTMRAGLNDSSTGDATDGVYARYTHGENSGNWVLVTRLASTETVGNSSIAYAAGWNTFEFYGSGTNSVVMWINGTPAVTNTANIPGGSARTRVSAMIQKLGGSTGTTARSIIMDYVKVGMGVVR